MALSLTVVRAKEQLIMNITKNILAEIMSAIKQIYAETRCGFIAFLKQSNVSGKGVPSMIHAST